MPWTLRSLARLSLALLLVIFFGPRFVQAADAIPGEELCDRPVESISFVGNKVTRRNVLLREMAFASGAPCSLDAIIDSIQSLMDMGLFKQVRAELRLRNEMLEARFIVKEKFFFLGIPRLSRTSDAELRFGLQLRWDNFTGRLHQLKLTSERREEEDGQGEAGHVHSLDYAVPRFFNSPYGLDVELSSVRRETELQQEEQTFGEAQERSWTLGLRLARWLNRSSGVQGLRVFGGVRVQDRSFTLRQGAFGPIEAGRDISVGIGIEQRELHQDTYRRRGLIYGASLSAASEFSGSDFQHHRFDFWMRWYKPLTGGLRNLNVHTRFGVSDGAPFGEKTYSIGGGELMRGMAPGRFGGDLLTLVNVEYLSALFSWPNLRYVLFMDIGNVFERRDPDLLDQRARAGVGLRWKIQALTNTDLRIDLAWDPAREKVKAYVSSSLTF